MSRVRSITIATCVVFASLAHWTIAAEPVFFSDNGSESVIDAKAQQWHAEFEKNGDYGEVWFFLAQMDDGGVIFASMSISNLGLRTFDSTCDVNYYAAKGKSFPLHREFTRDKIHAAQGKLDITIGACRIAGRDGTAHFTVSEPDFDLRLNLAGSLPPHPFGNGTVYFYPDRSAQASLGVMAPRAKVTGALKTSGVTFELAGNGYYDHNWSTIKLPSMLKKWFTLRIFDPKYTLILHDQHLTDTFGGGTHRFALLGSHDALIGPTNNFGYTPVKWRKDHNSGFDIPAELSLDLATAGYRVKGTIREQRFLDSIDALASISWPVRMMIQTFYAKPYFIRYLARYELDITNTKGVTEHISGIAPAEAVYY